jgi:hypothetical protein
MPNPVPFSKENALAAGYEDDPVSRHTLTG